MILSPVQSPCRITQRFGERPEVYAQFGLKGHNGIDFTGPQKGVLVPVFSPFDATVYEVGDQGVKGYGKHVRLRTAPNSKGIRREIIFGHLSVVSVELNQEVAIGDSLGIMGNTGFSSGPHLHLGLRRIAPDGTVIDAGNGFAGYVDFEKYLLFWSTDPKGMVQYA